MFKGDEKESGDSATFDREEHGADCIGAEVKRTPMRIAEMSFNRWFIGI